jgi:hypothetical protein
MTTQLDNTQKEHVAIWKITNTCQLVLVLIWAFQDAT